MKTYALAGAAIVGALAIPATASANVVAVTCLDGHPSASMVGWSSGNVQPYSFTIDGTPADSGMVRILTDPQVLTSSAVLTGEHDLVVTVSRFSASARVSCGTPPPVIPLTPPGQPPDVVPLQTPGGTTTAVQAGPGTTTAKVKKVKKVKRRVTCAYLRRVGAGPRTYARYGWTYRCRVTVLQRGPNLPAVTG